MAGYGSTTWTGLVPTKEHLNMAIEMSTPIKVDEGGRFFGAFAGYEFNPAFAIEASYMNYPNAKVFFDAMSLFSFKNHDLTEFITKTDTLNLMAKVMLVIPNTGLRFYSSLGAATVHRNDLLIDQWHFSPAFGGGLNYRFTHFLVELGGNYIAGYGESQLDPSATYFPFLYSLSLRLGYYF